MNTARKPFPWPVRLAMLAVLAPLFVAFLYGYWNATDTFEDRHRHSMKVAWDNLGMVFAFLVVPAAGAVFIFLKGYWRFGIVAMLSVFFLYGFFGDKPGERNDDHVKINLSVYALPGTEVYCNGVKIGETPLEIRVGELKARVPRWTSPPEQRWYVDGEYPIYTWIPWDHFLRDRYEKRNILGDADAIKRFDAGSEFWWSFRYKGSTAIGCKTGSDIGQRDFGDGYFHSNNAFSLVFPSKFLLHDLLLAELRENSRDSKVWNPSDAWIDFVAKKGKLLDGFFEQLAVGTRETMPYDPVLDTVARRRHGLSESPTPDECERLIQDVLDGERDRSSNRFTHDAVYGHSLSTEHMSLFGESYRCTDPLLDRALRQMAGACCEPLLRRCRAGELESDDDDSVSNALLYMLKLHPFPEFFEEMVRFYAMESRGFTTLTAFDDPRVAPLLETFLQREPLFRDLPRGAKCQALLMVENPLLEPVVRDYFARELPEIRNEYETKALLDAFVQTRWGRDKSRREELARWVEQLRIKGTCKVDALAMLKAPDDFDPDRIQLLYAPVGNEEPASFAWKELVRRVKKAPPEESIKVIFTELFDDSDPDKIGMAINALAGGSRFMDDDADTEAVFRKIWEDGYESSLLLGMINQSFVWETEPTSTITTYGGTTNLQRNFRIPGSYVSLQQSNTHINDFPHGGQTLRTRLPVYFVSLFAGLTKANDRINAARLLVYVDDPSAAALLESWEQDARDERHKRLRKVLETAREIQGYRMAIKKNLHELFGKLCDDEITPDDILPARSGFVWDGERYVEEASTLPRL